MTKLRVGLVGIGGICIDQHMPAWLKISEAEIVAVCDIKEKKFEKAYQILGKNIKTYTDYKNMIKSEKLDVLDICTPNYLHSEISVFALNNGVNVLCEKPDATSVEEAIAMQEAENRSGKKLMVIRNNRYLGTSIELKNKITSGEMGEIYAARCGWIRKRGIPGKGGWFTTKAKSGGGPLIDLGVHMIDLSIYLMGNPKAVSVSGSIYTKFANSTDEADSVHSKFGETEANGTFDVEDLAMGFIKFDNGACLQIEFSWASNIKEESRFVEMRGTKSGFNWNGETYDLFNNEKSKFFKTLRERSRQSLLSKNGHYQNIRHFVDVITKGVTPVYTIEQGLNMIKILTGIYESALSGKEIIL